LGVVRWFYWLLGAFGSSVVMSKWGSYEAKIMQLLDVKANIADSVLTGSTKTVSETVSAAKEQLNIDVAPSPKKP
jgi:lactam utilization protein B